MDEHQRGNGNDAVKQRRFAAGDGAGSQIGNQQRGDELVGLQLPDLPFAHHAQGKNGDSV